MKVGILTFPGSPSHGASLQMFALHKVLNDKNVDAEIINYSPDTVIHNRLKKERTQKSIKNIIQSVFVRDGSTNFERFESQLNFSSSAPITTTEQIKELSEKYDRIIVGSDQVWNPAVTGNDMNFYLEFCEDNCKKASYAPSFGVDNVAEDDKEKISKLLSEFTYLSVREKRGQEIVGELIGREVPIVLDPTFLVDADEWRKFKKPSGAKGKYVFVFTIKPSPKLKEAAQKYADFHGYNLVYIAGGLRGVLDKINPEKHPVFGVGPAEFLDLVDNAECVFTNSFHGTAFSIIFNKKFYVEFSSDTNSRLTNIVKTFGLENCAINHDSFDNSVVDIDYDKVNAILSQKKNDSVSYLEDIIR